MSLATIVHAGLTRPDRQLKSLVLMGGGARTAYQVSVLQALAAMLRLQPDRACISVSGAGGHLGRCAQHSLPCRRGQRRAGGI